jgi:hypothetical protein
VGDAAVSAPAALFQRWLSLRQSCEGVASDDEVAIGDEMIAVERSILIGTSTTVDDWRAQAAMLAGYAHEGLANANEDVVERYKPPPIKRP